MNKRNEQYGEGFRIGYEDCQYNLGWCGSLKHNALNDIDDFDIGYRSGFNAREKDEESFYSDF